GSTCFSARSFLAVRVPITTANSSTASGGAARGATSSRHLWPQRSGGASSAQARKRRGRSRVAFVVVDFPDDDEVLAHGFRFRPAWWTPRVSDGWGGFLNQLPAQDRGYCPIPRADLLDAAETHGLPQALLASYVWGTGSSAFLVG